MCRGSLSALLLCLNLALALGLTALDERMWIEKAREAYANAPVKPAIPASAKPLTAALRTSCSMRAMAKGKCPLAGLRGDTFTLDALLSRELVFLGAGSFRILLKENTFQESSVASCHYASSPTPGTINLIVYQQMYCYYPDPHLLAIGSVNTMSDTEGQLFVGCSDACPWEHSWNGYASNALALCLPLSDPLCKQMKDFCTPNNFYA